MFAIGFWHYVNGKYNNFNYNDSTEKETEYLLLLKVKLYIF